MKTTLMDDMIKSVVDIVFYTKFYFIKDPYLKDDLLQEGMLAAYTLLSSGDYNPTKDLRRYMYSWVWNAMSNYLYKNNKEVCTNLESVENLEVASYKIESPNITSINKNIIYDICKKYAVLGDYYNEVLIYLQSIGLVKNYKPKERLNINRELKDIITGMVLYKIFEEVTDNDPW